MEGTILNGPTMAVVGISTVFVALAIIVAIVSLIARILTPSGSAAIAQAAAVETPAAAEQDNADNKDRLQQVALAAYGFHLARRVSVRGHVASSPWLRAGRQAQVDRIPSRG